MQKAPEQWLGKRFAWRQPATVAGILMLLVALALYGLTLDNGLRPEELTGGDLITHQYAQVEGRPSNAPGYPLYTIGGWLWFRSGRLLLDPSFNPIPILSSYSTLWAIVGLAMLYALCLDVTGGNWLLSALCTAFYAVTYFFWYYAVTTEQYTSAVAQTLVLVLLAFRWDRSQGPHSRVGRLGERSADGVLLLLSLLVGVALAHMVTVLLIAPPLLWFVLSRRPALLRRPCLILSSLILLLLPLLSYLFVYVRGAQHPEWRGTGEWPSVGAWFWQFVSTRQGRGELTWSLRPLWTHEFPSLIWGELTWVVLLLGLVGIALLGRRRAVFLYATLLLYWAFCWVDRLGNWYQVIMPVYPLLVLGTAVTAGRIWRLARNATLPHSQSTGLVVRGALVAVLLALVGYRLALSYPRADSSDRPEDTGLNAGWAILADGPAVGAAVLGDHVENAALRYLTDIWGQRPDVTPVGTGEARELLGIGSPMVYATVGAVPLVWSEVSADARLSSAGATLVEVRMQPRMDVPAELAPLDRVLGDNLRLLGYNWHLPVASTFSRPLLLTLYWQATGPVTHDWSVSVRPTQNGQMLSQGGARIQRDHQHPVQGLYPTTRWVVGEVVRDDYPLPLPAGAAVDEVTVIVYRPVGDGFENLSQVDLSGPPEQ